MSWWKSIPFQLLCWSWNVLVGCWSSIFLGMRIMVSHLQYEGLLAKSFQVGLTMIIATPQKMPKSNILLRSWYIMKNILLKIIKHHFGGCTINAIYVCWLTPPIVAFDLKNFLGAKMPRRCRGLGCRNCRGPKVCSQKDSLPRKNQWNNPNFQGETQQEQPYFHRDQTWLNCLLLITLFFPLPNHAFLADKPTSWGFEQTCQIWSNQDRGRIARHRRI